MLKCMTPWTHNFESWVRHKGQFSRVPEDTYDILASMHTKDGRIEYTKEWQERKCKDCGLIQKRNL